MTKESCVGNMFDLVMKLSKYMRTKKSPHFISQKIGVWGVEMQNIFYMVCKWTRKLMYADDEYLGLAILSIKSIWC